MIEALYAALLTLTGAGLLAPWKRGVAPVALGWLAFPIGSAMYVLLSLVMLVVGGRVEPLVVVGVCVAAGAVGLGLTLSRGLLADLWVVIAIAVGATFVIGVVAWSLPLARLTIDSGEYLLGASQIRADGAVDLMAPFLLKRQMGLQALHALASSSTRAHVAWVGPFFGVSAVGFTVWLVWSRMSGTRRWRIAVAGGVVAFLVSSNRFFYDFFYIHPHIQMAVFLLVGVTGIWLAVLETKPVWGLVAGVSLATTLVLRPESPLLVAVVLVVAAASPARGSERRLIAVPSLLVIVLWYGFILWSAVPGGDAIGVTEPVFSSLLAVIGACAVVLVLEPGRFDATRHLLGRALVPGLVGVLLVYTISDPIILRDSLVATFRNLKRLGWWVATWAVVVPLAAVGLLVARFRLAELWSRIVVGFALLFFTFPYLRGSPWRVGPGDSGNRMLAHFLLVVLVFAMLALSEDADQVDAGVPASGDRLS